MFEMTSVSLYLNVDEMDPEKLLKGATSDVTVTSRSSAPLT